MDVKRIYPLLGLSFLIVFMPFSSTFAQDRAASSPQKSVIGDLRLHQFKSQVFGNTRVLRVLLPAGYNERANRNKRYPVLYLNDGQNLFDSSTSVFNPLEWRADETLDSLIRGRELEPLIIVGLDNAGRSERANEYLPYPDAFLRPPLPNPEGSRYPEFLTGEVIPFITGQYRTLSGPKYTALGGSSYGALIALYTVTKRPGTFGRLLLESPSLYVSDGRILKDNQKTTMWPQRIYIGVGTNEDGRGNCKPGDWNQEAVQDVLKLKQMLESGGMNNKSLNVVVEECSIHNEAAWGKRLPAALKFLYGKGR